MNATAALARQNVSISDMDLEAWIIRELQEDSKAKGEALLSKLKAEGYRTARYRFFKAVKAARDLNVVKTVAKKKAARKAREASGRPVRVLDHRNAKVTIPLRGRGFEWKLSGGAVVKLPCQKRLVGIISWSPDRNDQGRAVRSRSWMVIFERVGFRTGGRMIDPIKYATREEAIESLTGSYGDGKVELYERPTFGSRS